MRIYDSYSTYTPAAEIAICENCPYPKPECGQDGCKHFKEQKAALLEKKKDKRRSQKRKFERIKKEKCKV